MPHQNTQTDEKLIPGEALIYERAAGIVYARYRDPPHNTKPRWIIGGDPQGFIPGTSMPKPEEWLHFQQCTPDWKILQKSDKLREMYTAFLIEQDKYVTWEKLNEQ
jgi:hypothetical protein